MSQAAEYYQHSRENLAPFLPPRYQRVLEIGCGEGSFWENLNLSAGAEIWGVEPNQAAASIAVGKAHRVFNATYDDCAKDLPDHYFDLVICNDVIEHMPDHDHFLSVIRQKMTPDASLVGSLPNIRYYQTLRSLIFKKDWRYEDSGILDRTHLRFFTARSMQRTFIEHGYRIEMFGGINSPGRFKFFLLFLNIVLLGTAMDTRFQQFAFRLKLS